MYILTDLVLLYQIFSQLVRKILNNLPGKSGKALVTFKYIYIMQLIYIVFFSYYIM